MLVRLNGRAVRSVLVDARVTRLSAVVVAPTNGALGAIRTPDPRNRNPMLYPAELRVPRKTTVRSV